MAKVMGRRIRQLRQERGWSVQDLAERTRSLAPPGISRSALGRVEQEKTKNVAAWRLESIAKALDVPISDLISGADNAVYEEPSGPTLQTALRLTTRLGESDIGMLCEFIRFLEERRSRS